MFEIGTNCVLKNYININIQIIFVWETWKEDRTEILYKKDRMGSKTKMKKPRINRIKKKSAIV